MARRPELLALLVLALAACTTKVQRLALPVTPPALEELPGNYLAHFGGPANLLAACTLGLDDLHFAPYPCPGATADVGGSFEYEPVEGAFAAELKTLDGGTKLTVSGTWSAGPSFLGTFAVQVQAAPCTSGPLTLERVPPAR